MAAGTHIQAPRTTLNCVNDACPKAKISFYRSGIGPEAFAYVSADGDFTGSIIAPDQLNFYKEHGFYITSSYYILRPEVLESNFYAYRVTGDPKYLDRAATAIDAFNRYLRTDTGYAGLNDVDNPRRRIDDTETFWFSEVLKYL
jgi:mannosyl-oligosaccharide alpha-1,2-mannosidase